MFPPLAALRRIPSEPEPDPVTSPAITISMSLVGLFFSTSIPCPLVPMTVPETVIEVSPVPECSALMPDLPVTFLLLTVIKEPSL